jgi:uncharacterized protein (DUF2237 family)
MDWLELRTLLHMEIDFSEGRGQTPMPGHTPFGPLRDRDIWCLYWMRWEEENWRYGWA